MADDRWWHGVDDIVVAAVPAGSRVLDVGCGDGGLVARLAERGLDAMGVDPQAPEGTGLIRARVEDAGPIGPFDAVAAVMSLHHVTLAPVLAAIRRLLAPDGRLVVFELAWETYDDRAASWVARHDPSGADRSVAAWHAEHAGLHPSTAVRAAIADALDLRDEVARPYLARMLGSDDLEDEEQRLIDADALPALGRWYVAAAPLG